MALSIADLAISSDDFAPGERIPERLSADGGNETPRLTVSGVPEGAVELALIVHDPDAPLANGFTHWVVYGLPAVDGPIDESAGRAAPNGTGQPGWFGPQPPAGHGEHHYYAWVYALSAPVEGTPTREEFLASAQPTILEQARLVGSFSR